MSKVDPQQPSILDRHLLNNLQHAVEHQTNAKISFIFHLLATGTMIAILKQFKPLEINNVVEEMLPILKIIEQVSSRFTPNEEQPFRLGIVVGSILGMLEHKIENLSAFLNPHHSKINPLDLNLSNIECQNEINRLTQQINISWFTWLEQRLINNFKDYLFIMGHALLLGKTLDHSNLNTYLNTYFLAPVYALLIRLLPKKYVYWDDVARRKRENTLCQPILDETNNVLSQFPSTQYIHLEFIENKLEHKTHLTDAWLNQFSDQGTTMIYHQTRISKDPIFKFYIMLIISLSLKKYFDIEPILIDENGIIANVTEIKVDKRGWWFSGQSSTLNEDKLLSFTKTIKNSVTELTVCYSNIERFKVFIRCLLGDLIPSKDAIAVSFQNGDLPSFNVKVPFALEKSPLSRSINLLSVELARYGLRDEKIGYHFLAGDLHLTFVNSLLKLLTPNKASGYNQTAKIIYRVLKDLKPLSTIADRISSSIPPDLKTEDLSAIEDSKKSKKKERRRPLEENQRITVNPGLMLSKVRLFAPVIPIKVTRIEFSHHCPWDISEDKDQTSPFLFKNQIGEVIGIALLLDIDGDAKSQKELAEILERDKVIATHEAKGNYIRQLTKLEIDQIGKTKPKLFTMAHKLYDNKVELSLTHKIRQKEGARVYGFSIKDESAKVHFNNGTQSTKKPVTLFCVRDKNPKKDHRSSGLQVAASDPFFVPNNSFTAKL